MVRNQVSARPTERKGSSKTRSKKNVESSAPRAQETMTRPAPAPRPEPVKAKGELPVPIATYVL
jgi:hypothetical protein